MKKNRLPGGPWLSTGQYARKYGYSDSTVRKWLRELETDARLTLEQRLAISQGPRRAVRIHEQRFAIWLALPRENEPRANAVFVIAAGTIQ